MDVLTKKQRSYCMSRIGRRDTTPEMRLRMLFRRKGIRGYRIDAKIKGRPDLYFPRRKLAVFIDGCFWHRCPKCFIRPKTNRAFWTPKIRGNVLRDRHTNLMLKKQGVTVLRLWEHETEGDMTRCYTKFQRAYVRCAHKIQKDTIRRRRPEK